AEIAGQHLRRRNELDRLRRRRSDHRDLLSAEEEELVLDERSPDRAAKLIPFQIVARRCKRVARVENAIAKEFENVTMNTVRSGLGYAVDRGGRVMAVLRGQCAGLDLELLKCIGKRQGQIQIVVLIVV